MIKILRQPQRMQTGLTRLDDINGFTTWQRQQHIMLQGKSTNSEAFGNTVWDPNARIWRHYYHNNCSTTTGTIYMMTSRDGRIWENPTQVFAAAGGDAWDSASAGVPFVWHEPATARPWRMIYRGTDGSNKAAIGMATSLNGTTWERKNSAGTVLTDPIITSANGIDFGNVFYDSVSGLYFLYWNTIAPPRIVYLSTSSDLITWTLYADGAAVFAGAENAANEWDYDDAAHNSGHASDVFGYYCGFYGRYDLPDGTPRYLAIVTAHMAAEEEAGRAAFTVWTSTSPYMTKANRTYIGKFLHTLTGQENEGSQLTSLDTPTIVCDDITQDVQRSILTGNELWCPVCLVDTDYHNYATEMLTRRRDISIASLVNVDINFPTERPVIRLAPVGDANTKGLWLPELTGSLRDFSGNANHMKNVGGTFTSGGLHLTGASSQYATRPHGTLDTIFAALNAITGDFCIEMDLTLDTLPSVGDAYRYVFAMGQASSVNMMVHFQYDDEAGKYLRAFIYARGIGTDGADDYGRSSTLSWLAGERHILTICRSVDTVYFFVDGVAFGSSIKKAGAITQCDLPASTIIGAEIDLTAGRYFDGTVHAVRLSNYARHAVAYTPTKIAHGYVTSGSLFSTVYDMGRIDAEAEFAVPGAAVPAGTTITLKSRAAASLTDVSADIADFATIPNRQRGRYRQFAIVMAGPGTATPSIPHVVIGRKP